MRVIRYDPIDYQKEFHDTDDVKFLHLSGGYGSGKTRSLCMKAIKLHYENRPYDIGLFAPSIADYKKDVLPTMHEILEESGVWYDYHQTDKWFKLPWSEGVIQVFGCERKIRGPNLAAALINEVTLISFERFKEIIGRVRVKGAKIPQIATSGTPEGISHWLYEFHVEHPSPSKKLIYADTRKNPHLASDYIKTLEESYDKTMLDAYLRGLFVNMNSNRFYYAYDPHKNDDTSIERLPGHEVHISLDFNVAPMCATAWHILPVKDSFGQIKLEPDGSIMEQAIAFDQIEILDGADTSKMCMALIARGYTPGTTTIYPDPAGRARSTKGPPDIEILKNHGFTKIKVKLVAPEFRKRQLNTNNLLEKGRVRINPNTCPGLKKDFLGVEQDQASFEKIKTNPKLTHYSDGFDYMADHIFTFSGHKPQSRSIKFR